MDCKVRSGLAMALIVATFGAQATAPAVIIVAGDCTLPDAIDAANTDLAVGGCDAGSGADEVRLTGDVVLTEVDNYAYGENGLPQVTSEIALTGGGFTIERLNEAPDFRLFQVASNATLTLSSVHLLNGAATFPDDPADQGFNGGAIHSQGSVRLTAGSVVEDNAAFGAGGGIWSSGSLILNDSTVSDNFGGDGAGIYSRGYLKLVESRVERNYGYYSAGAGIMATGPTVVIASSITANEADFDDGGGILLLGPGTLYLRNSTVSGNSATGPRDYHRGGGLALRSGTTATIVNSTLSDNRAGYYGGGLDISDAAQVILINSTISGNHAGEWGGGIYARFGEVTLVNSTVSGNSANRGGGGIYARSGEVTLVHSTVADNDRGGLQGGRGVIALANSVLGLNTGPNCSGPIEDLGGNLADDASCGAGVGDLTGLDRVLRDNGGPTLTHALLPESSAIDAAGDCEQATDQRGFVRDAVCDSGSFEFGAVPLRVALAGSCPGALTVGIRGASADGRVAVLRGSRAGLFELAAGPCAGTLVGLADPRPLAQVTADADGMFVTEVNVPAAACGDLLQVVDHLSCAVSNVAAIP